MFDDNNNTYWHSSISGPSGYHWIKVTFKYEVILTGVKLMLYGSIRYADRICVYSGLYHANASSTMVGCLSKEETYTMHELKYFKADMLRTREVFIDYTGKRAITRELEIDYIGE